MSPSNASIQLPSQVHKHPCNIFQLPIDTHPIFFPGFISPLFSFLHSPLHSPLTTATTLNIPHRIPQLLIHAPRPLRTPPLSPNNTLPRFPSITRNCTGFNIMTGPITDQGCVVRRRDNRHRPRSSCRQIAKVMRLLSDQSSIQNLKEYTKGGGEHTSCCTSSAFNFISSLITS